MNKQLVTTSSPHIRSNEDVTRVMLDVIIALVPAIFCAIYYFGYRSAIILAVAIIFAVFTEYVCQKVMKKPSTIGDLSAVVTGLLLGLNLSSEVPFWMPAVGSIFAIFIVKQVFGGIGQNYMNPALAARVFLAISYTNMMSVFATPFGGEAAVSAASDAASGATPLALLKTGNLEELPSILEMFLGHTKGVMGETAAVALLVGGIYLLIRKVIDWRIPLFFIGTVFVMTFLLYDFNVNTALVGILSGGVMLGAIFMATDFVTCPITKVGRIIFAIGCGVLTVLIRKVGAYPEGVMFAILLMNAFTPAIEKITTPKVFGGVKK